MQPDTFNRLKWYKDRVLLDDLVFRIIVPFQEDDSSGSNWELGDECLVLSKNKPIIDLYQQFFSLRADFQPENVFELGIFAGGSVALWFEILQPRKLVAIDIEKRTDTHYFNKYKQTRNLADRIQTYWGVDQSDSASLRNLASREFSAPPAPLDLVIDDASHIYEPTLSSFETLFPLLRPGGLYIIEDWAWEHAKPFHQPGNIFAGRNSLTGLVTELIEATGSGLEHQSEALITNIYVNQTFTVIERGPWIIEDPASFRLSDHISRRPPGVRPAL